jgi:arylsulfatase A-like enzyme
VLAKLDELGLAENTIIVLWGDHGWHLGDHSMWCKHSNFEQATRNPLIISTPELPKGRKTEAMAESSAIFPTLSELAKLPVPESLQGTSLVPLLKNPESKGKDFAMSQYPRGGGRMGYALRTDRYRLVMWMKDDWRSTMPFDSALVEAVELYDYQNDPLETGSQAKNAEYADVLKDLQSKMLKYFKSCEH